MVSSKYCSYLLWWTWHSTIGLVRAGSEFYVDIQCIDKMQTDPSIGFELPQQTSQFRMNGECVQPLSSGRVQVCPALCLVTLNSPIDIKVVCKFTFNSEEARLLQEESQNYDSAKLRCLQGDVIPYLYGLFTNTKLGITCMILQDCGDPSPNAITFEDK